MDFSVLVIFVIVYLGLILGGIPGLALDRTGMALLGTFALLILGKITLHSAWQSVDVPTLALLFGFMILSAQFRLGGFYARIVQVLVFPKLQPKYFLAVVISITALLSALLVNDVVCLALTPVLIETCYKLRFDPKPQLLGLACAANIGSAATIIGNPQNILIGQVLHLSFSKHLFYSLAPVILGLIFLWLFLVFLTHNHWFLSSDKSHQTTMPAYSVWQTTKGLVLLFILIGCFLFTSWPREIGTLAVAGILLSSRHMHTRRILGLVDWQLLTLFIALFILNSAFASAGGLEIIRNTLTQHGIQLSSWPWLMFFCAVLSNLVSNVPAVMLLLPFAHDAHIGSLLALTSTFAGNFIVIGSIANIIVLDQASHHGITIRWVEHARIGIPISIITLLITALWFLIIG